MAHRRTLIEIAFGHYVFLAHSQPSPQNTETKKAVIKLPPSVIPYFIYRKLYLAVIIMATDTFAARVLL